MVREFRWTLIGLGVAVAFAAAVYLLSPADATGGREATPLVAIYGAWMALLSQPIYSPPGAWYLALLQAIYPLLGFILFGEGIVRLAMLLMSRRQGEKEWMRVMASTYRDHVILCGLGHLGYRILQQLTAAGVPVVAIEKAGDGRFVAQARETGIPILIRDMKEDQALIDAGIRHARSIIIATNDDMANVEVAIDARRMNSVIRIIMRLFDQQIAGKISGVLSIDMAFSASALAAPVVAAMSMDTHVLSTHVIGGTSYAIAELVPAASSPLVGSTVAQVEANHRLHVLNHAAQGGTPTAAIPAADRVVAPGDTLVVHLPASALPTLSAIARATSAA